MDSGPLDGHSEGIVESMGQTNRSFDSGFVADSSFLPSSPPSWTWPSADVMQLPELQHFPYYPLPNQESSTDSWTTDSWTYRYPAESFDQRHLYEMQMDSLPPISSIQENIFDPSIRSRSWAFPSPSIPHEWNNSAHSPIRRDWAEAGEGGHQTWSTASSGFEWSLNPLPEVNSFQHGSADDEAEDSGLGTQSTFREQNEERDWDWFIKDD
jgi:hypothetical protein